MINRYYKLLVAVAGAVLGACSAEPFPRPVDECPGDNFETFRCTVDGLPTVTSGCRTIQGTAEYSAGSPTVFMEISETTFATREGLCGVEFTDPSATITRYSTGSASAFETDPVVMTNLHSVAATDCTGLPTPTYGDRLRLARGSYTVVQGGWLGDVLDIQARDLLYRSDTTGREMNCDWVHLHFRLFDLPECAMTMPVCPPPSP